MNATGRCSRLWDPTIEALKLAGEQPEMIPGPWPGFNVRKVRLLSVDRKLRILVDAIPRVLFYAEVVDEHTIDVFHNKETTARFGIEDFAESKAPCRPSRV